MVHIKDKYQIVRIKTEGAYSIWKKMTANDDDGRQRRATDSSASGRYALLIRSEVKLTMPLMNKLYKAISLVPSHHLSLYHYIMHIHMAFSFYFLLTVTDTEHFFTDLTFENHDALSTITYVSHKLSQRGIIKWCPVINLCRNNTQSILFIMLDRMLHIWDNLITLIFPRPLFTWWYCKILLWGRWYTYNIQIMGVMNICCNYVWWVDNCGGFADELIIHVIMYHVYNTQYRHDKFVAWACFSCRTSAVTRTY